MINKHSQIHQVHVIGSRQEIAGHFYISGGEFKDQEHVIRNNRDRAISTVKASCEVYGALKKILKIRSGIVLAHLSGHEPTFHRSIRL